MKKGLFLLALLIVLASCGSGAKLTNSASYSGGVAPMIVTPVQADLKVISTDKISFTLTVKDEVRAGGVDNAIATAVSEALSVIGGDAIVGLQTQLTYDAAGLLRYVRIQGYPAKYVNFRIPSSAEPVSVSDAGNIETGFGVTASR